MGFMLVNQKKKSVVYRKKSRVDFKCSAPNEQKEAYEKFDIRVQIDRVSVWSLILSNTVRPRAFDIHGFM
jgi:hypothetical protein